MTQNGQLAVVFPGQGSQQVGMLQAHAEQWPAIRDTFSEASEALGYDLWQLIQDGPQERLNLTEFAQPALLTASVALWRVLQSTTGVQPGCMAGHSLGEWSALVCSGALAFTDAVRLVQLRGRYMQEAVPAGQGAMAAIIGLPDQQINDVCAQVAQGEVVAAVNFNSPGQVVIAGQQAAVDRAMAGCKEAGAKKVMPLAVSAPFHTSLMQPAADRLAADLAQVEFNTPATPVIHNVHAQPEEQPSAIKALIIQQISAPVQWVQCVQTMQACGVNQVVECGPGKVLTGLLKRIDKSLKGSATDDVAALEAVVQTLNSANANARKED